MCQSAMQAVFHSFQLRKAADHNALEQVEPCFFFLSFPPSVKRNGNRSMAYVHTAVDVWLLNAAEHL